MYEQNNLNNQTIYNTQRNNNFVLSSNQLDYINEHNNNDACGDTSLYKTNSCGKHNIKCNKRLQKNTQFYSLICCLNSIYIDNYYILKYKGYDFLNNKTHFIYSYVYKFSTFYDNVKKNKNLYVSTSEILEKKASYPFSI